MKQDLLVSFSGGRTSAYMSYFLKKHFSDMYNLFFVFANTGQEMEETLKFVDECDRYFNLGLTWVEAKVNPIHRKGTKHTIVDFKSADRVGVNFEDVMKKYGISNRNYPHCTRELKQRPIHSYAKTISRKYLTAIGIRGDEYRRVIKNQTALVYPLADWDPRTKEDINNFWVKQPFNLELEEHHGNCSWCWKKSFKKLFRLIDESPEIFDFPRRMEEKYIMAGPSGQPQVFFRTGLSTEKLFRECYASLSTGKYFDGTRGIGIDKDDGCSESCEMYEMS